MSPEAAAGRIASLTMAIPAPWRGALLRLACVWLVLILLFLPEWQAMARQWWNSSTYNHILLIPFLLVWLVQQRLTQLARLEPALWWPALALFAASAFAWLLGSFSGLALGSQIGAVAVLASSALTLLGPRVGAVLAFPLAYMFLLVPFGDELVPALQMITAVLTVGLVHFTNIPAQIDGVFINTPAGLFEVAEACSGVKFLIAMIAFGVLVAHVCFRSWTRRAVFFAFCLAVPILANGVRAWATIFAAQYVGAEAATGFDHIIYGWIFFAIVVAIVILASWRFFDRPPGDPLVDMQRIETSPLLARLEHMTLRAPLALMLMAAMGLGVQAWARAAEGMAAPLPSQIFLPDVAGWQRTNYSPKVWWEPRAAGADHRLLGSYSDKDGRKVDVFLAVYASQGEGREAGGFGEGALPPGQSWSWMSPGTAPAEAKGDRLLAHGEIGRLTETYYRSGDLLSGSNARLKLVNMQDRLLLRARPTMLLILSAEEGGKQSAPESLAAFRRSAGPLDTWMDRIVGVR